MAAFVGASAALHISEIPFNGPIAALRVGRVEGEFLANPTPEQLEEVTIEGLGGGAVFVGGEALTLGDVCCELRLCNT